MVTEELELMMAAQQKAAKKEIGNLYSSVSEKRSVNAVM